MFGQEVRGLSVRQRLGEQLRQGLYAELALVGVGLAPAVGVGLWWLLLAHEGHLMLDRVLAWVPGLEG